MVCLFFNLVPTGVCWCPLRCRGASPVQAAWRLWMGEGVSDLTDKSSAASGHLFLVGFLIEPPFWHQCALLMSLLGFLLIKKRDEPPLAASFASSEVGAHQARLACFPSAGIREAPCHFVVPPVRVSLPSPLPLPAFRKSCRMRTSLSQWILVSLPNLFPHTI